MAEVNAVNSWARAMGVEDDAGLDFQRNLAVQMLESNIDNKLFHGSPKKARSTRARVPISRRGGDHGVMNHPYFTSEWLRKSLKKAKEKYHKTYCYCGNQCRIYCRCNNG